MTPRWFADKPAPLVKSLFLFLWFLLCFCLLFFEQNKSSLSMARSTVSLAPASVTPAASRTPSNTLRLFTFTTYFPARPRASMVSAIIMFFLALVLGLVASFLWVLFFFFL